MLSDGQSELTSCLIVRYHPEALDYAPSEIVVIKNRGEIDQIIGLLHQLPDEGDDDSDPGFESEYIVLVFLDEQESDRTPEQFDSTSDSFIEIYAGRIKADCEYSDIASYTG